MTGSIDIFASLDRMAGMGLYPSDPYRRAVANRDPEEEALGWVMRLSDGDASDDDRAEFAFWREEADNAAAYEGAQRLWQALGPILEDRESRGWPAPPTAKPALSDETPHASSAALNTRSARGGFRRWYAGGLAAAFLLTTLTAHRYLDVWQYDAVSETGVAGETALADGSRMTMGPDTAVNTDFALGVRHVTLARGEAYFDVKHDAAHPFIVSTGNGLVRVLGTAFAVRADADGQSMVTVTRGRVQVTSGAHSVVLTPDRQVAFDRAGLKPVRAVEASRATAWVRGRLIMEDRSLKDVVAEIQRYRGGRIVLLNREAGQRRINAVIDLDRTDNWLIALASSQGLKLASFGPVTILR